MTLDPQTRPEDRPARRPGLRRPVHEGHAELPAVRVLGVRREHPQHLDPEVHAPSTCSSDADVRAGMKEYSDWPTFPQLFIKGEFVGGADIVSQMYETGELEKKLGDARRAGEGADGDRVARAPRRSCRAALKEASPGDVIHLTITPGWEHQLDLGAEGSEPRHGRRRRHHRPARSRERGARRRRDDRLRRGRDRRRLQDREPESPRDGARDRAEASSSA